MAGLKMQFPEPGSVNNKWQDTNGQWWIYNNEAWVRRGEEPGIQDAPYTGQQFARVRPEPNFADPANPIYPPGYWELVQADVWYLGAHEVDPSTDTFGAPLVEGHTYYNTVSHVMMVWDGVEWDAFSGVSEIATLWEYRWDSLGAQIAPFTLDALNPIIPDPPDPAKPNQGLGDDHNNVPFDQWERGLIVVMVYINGIRQIEKRMLTPGYGEPPNDIPQRPADEEDRIDFVDKAAFPPTGQIYSETGVTYYDLATKETWYWDIIPATATAPVVYDYILGGAELEPEHYNYTVDFKNQEITFLQNLPDGASIVIETGTLAASQYLKSTYENAEDWAFVTHECDMGKTNPSRGKLPSQAAVNCYVKAALIAAEARSTNALIGTVFDFAGPNPPANALICDGRAVSKEHYKRLYAAIGNTWNNFNGAPSPSSGQFRVPFSEINSQVLYTAGTQGAHSVGTFLKDQNRNHSHLHTHSHTGSVGNATGAHDHYNYWRTAGIGGVTTGGGGKTIVDKLISKSFYDSEKRRGSIHAHRIKDGLATATGSSSNITISTDSGATGSDGGTSARPNTMVMLKCIWADIIVEEENPIFDINKPT